MNVTLLGCGRWGSFIAWYMNRKGYNVTVWGLAGDPIVSSLFETRKNEYVEFPKEIELTNDLSYALSKSEYIIISISSQHLRDLMQKVNKITGYDKKKYCLCMKGIEESTGKRLSVVMNESGVSKDNVAVWVGPGHIQEFTKGIPNLMIIDSLNKKLSGELIKKYKSDLIRFYQGEDLIGTEIGAASKNVMGIAAGMLDGGNYSVVKGALMARGAREISRLIKAAGGNELSAYGLCHLGDYEATLFSLHSNNRKFGESFVRKEPFTKLAEGVTTAAAMLKMAKNLKVELPITNAVYEIIINKKEPKEVLSTLFKRQNTNEF